MSRLTVTDEELQDVSKVWTSDELFKLSNVQLQTIHAVRDIAYADNDVKRTLVKNIVDMQDLGTGEPTASEAGTEAEAAAMVDEGGKDPVAEEDAGMVKTPAYSAGAAAGGELDEKAAAEAAAIQARADNMLYGSSVQPSHFGNEAGETVQLGTVVAKAQTASGLSPMEWNKLDDESREEYIAAAVGELGLRPVVGEGETLAEKPVDPQDVVDAKKQQKGPALLSHEHDKPAEEVLKADAHVQPTELSTHTLHGHIDDLKGVA